MLVFDTHLSVYKDVLSGAPQRTAIPIPDHILPSLHPGASMHRPRWVQWDKAPRNLEFPKECFYIVREDGRVMYMEQGPAGAVDMDDAGEWPNQIDTAFACFSFDNSEFSQSYPDILMTGAVGSDGLLCKVGAWPLEYSYATQYPSMNQFTYVESIPNWTPITGLCVTDLSRTRNPYGRERCAMFVANGSAPHGQVSELRYGLRAVIDGSFGGMDGCTGLWVIRYGTQTVELNGKLARQHYVLMLVSLPFETLLFRLVRTQPESHANFTGPWDDGVWDIVQLPTGDDPIDDGILRDEETISACIVSDRFSIQVTRGAVQILDMQTLALRFKVDFSNPILLAASRADCHFIAIAFKDDGITYLDVLRVLEDGTFKESDGARSQYALSADPTCIELLDIAGQIHIFVGTFDSRIWLFRVSSAHDLFQVFQSTLDAEPIERSRTLCEGAVVLTLDHIQTLVCATRDGLLLSQDIHTMISDSTEMPTSMSEFKFASVPAKTPNPWNVTRMGSISARVHASSIGSATAFVSCGSEFCLIRSSPDKPGVVDVDSIWLTDQDDPGYLQRPVTATYQLPRIVMENPQSGRNLSGFLFVVSGKQLLCTQLDVDKDIRHREDTTEVLARVNAKPLPRKVITFAKPTYATYLKLPRKMLVATVEGREERAPPDGHRVIHSSLNLLDVHDEKPVTEAEVKQEVDADLSNRLVIAQYALNSAERVYSIADWAFEDDRGKKYNLVIVGTGVREGPGKESGRRLIFNLGQRGTRLSLQKESSYSNPVYCVAMFDRRSTVSVIGKTIHFDEFNAGLGR